MVGGEEGGMEEAEVEEGAVMEEAEVEEGAVMEVAVMALQGNSAGRSIWPPSSPLSACTGWLHCPPSLR
eukprot:scaffold4737_cov371-Prasinococcus_capsulatus_cf.AAC.4